MKLPSVKEARDQWGITKLDVTHHDQNIDNTRILLQAKFNKIIQDIRNNEYIIGLNQYDLNDNEIYAIHMMLLLHENIILAEENNTVKYVYIDSFAKLGLGIKAFGFYWLDIDLARYIRKKYKINNDKIFQDICFILNTLMGYAFRNNSSISNKNIINIFTLANNLFMTMDQFLIALTVLIQNRIVLFNRYDVNGNFKFLFCDYLSIAIDQRLKVLQQMIQKNEQEVMQEKTINEDNIQDDNTIKEADRESLLKLKYTLESGEKVEIDNNELNNQFSLLINYFKSKQNSYDKYYMIPSNIVKNDTALMKQILKNKLFNHPNIIFQPHNYEANKNIQYEYQYVNHNLKKESFSDYCIYRFVSYKIVKIIQLFLKRYTNISYSLPQIINVLNFIHKKFIQYIGNSNSSLCNITDKIKFTGNWFSTAGFLDKQEYIDILYFLKDIGIIYMTDINNSEKQVSLNIQLTHKYDNLTIAAEQAVKQMIEYYKTQQNNKNNIEIENNNENLNESLNNEISTNIDNNNSEKYQLENKKLIEEIKQLKQQNDQLIQENNQLLTDNTQLLLKLSDYRKFNLLLKDIDITTLKQQIELQMSILFNQVNNELNNVIQLNTQDNKQLLQQLNCQKQIFNLITNTEHNIKHYFFN